MLNVFTYLHILRITKKSEHRREIGKEHNIVHSELTIFFNFYHLLSTSIVIARAIRQTAYIH